jgi:hypothetical protein
MKDLKDAIKDAGLQTDFGLTEIGKFDPLCSACIGGCSIDCANSCKNGCSGGGIKGDPQQ